MPVEKYEDVFVVPAAAVVRDGPEAYVFRQNGDLFKQLPVHVLHEDRQSIVIANDGSIPARELLGAKCRRFVESSFESADSQRRAARLTRPS